MDVLLHTAGEGAMEAMTRVVTCYFHGLGQFKWANKYDFFFLNYASSNRKSNICVQSWKLPSINYAGERFLTILCILVP